MILKMLVPILHNKIISKIFGLEKKTTKLFSRVDALMDKVSNRMTNQLLNENNIVIFSN